MIIYSTITVWNANSNNDRPYNHLNKCTFAVVIEFTVVCAKMVLNSEN